MFRFRHRYPQSFLDKLAKALGIKWTKVDPTLVPKKKVRVKPLSKPTGTLYYFDTKYKK